MQITLNEKEIKKAIVAYVSGRVEITGEVVVNLTAGRAPNGMSAAIDIDEDDCGDCQDKVEVEPESEDVIVEEPAKGNPEEEDGTPLFGN